MPEPTTALLLIAHGSRLPEANADLEHVAEELRSRGHYPIIRAAYLELADPNIESAAARCVEEGAMQVILLPYFLSPGKHVVEDLAAIRARLSSRYGGVQFALAEPLGPHTLLLEILEERARNAASRARQPGV